MPSGHCEPAHFPNSGISANVRVVYREGESDGRGVDPGQESPKLLTLDKANVKAIRQFLAGQGARQNCRAAGASSCSCWASLPRSMWAWRDSWASHSNRAEKLKQDSAPIRNPSPHCRRANLRGVAGRAEPPTGASRWPHADRRAVPGIATSASDPTSTPPRIRAKVLIVRIRPRRRSSIGSPGLTPCLFT